LESGVTLQALQQAVSKLHQTNKYVADIETKSRVICLCPYMSAVRSSSWLAVRRRRKNWKTVCKKEKHVMVNTGVEPVILALLVPRVNQLRQSTNYSGERLHS
jgi:hypothetical protein